MLPRDLFAGTVVSLVARPLCLGIANASGVDPFAGLPSGIVGGLVFAVLSRSRLSVSGPAAGLVVIVADGIAPLGSFPEFLLAVLLSGAIQFVFGMLKAGRLAAYVPTPVIKGMLAAIGLLLIVTRLPLALGVERAASAAREAGTIATPFGSLSIAAATVAALSLAILAAWETRALRRFVSVFALTGVINLIPLACLAAILILTGARLAKPALFLAVARQGFGAFAPFAVTLIGVFAAILLVGIVLGVLCGVLIAVCANLRIPIALAQHDDHYLLSFRKDVSFLGKAPLKHCLQQIPDGATLIVDATRADFVDHDVCELIDAFVADAPQRGIVVDYRKRPRIARDKRPPEQTSPGRWATRQPTAES